MFFLYILKSLKLDTNYTGVTNNLNDRLKKHNNGGVKSTKLGRPWVLIYSEEFSTLSEARKREWFLKYTPQGGKLKKKILKMAGIPAQRA